MRSRKSLTYAKTQKGKQYPIFNKEYSILKVSGGATSVLPGIGDPNSQNHHEWGKMGGIFNVQERGEDKKLALQFMLRYPLSKDQL